MNDHNDTDPDADIMARAQAIVQEECAYGHCPDMRLCETVGKLAVRIARLEREKENRDLIIRATLTTHKG